MPPDGKVENVTRIVVETEETPTEEVPVVIAEEPESDDVLEDVPIDEGLPVEPEGPSIHDHTSEALTILADAVGDIEEVLAHVVQAIDDIVDYLDTDRAREQEEHAETLPDVPKEEIKKAKKQAEDIPPEPRTRVRAALLGRSGGFYR
jgi:hypothetical protein